MVITYETDAAEIADQVPEPLEPLDRPASKSPWHDGPQA
jgi:acetoacetate decarboxylase